MRQKYTFEIRKTRGGQHYWRVIHRNTKEIARSSETYKRHLDCKRSLDRLIDGITAIDYSMKDERDGL